MLLAQPLLGRRHNELLLEFHMADGFKFRSDHFGDLPS
jgi:hypothetical protein